MQPKNERNLRRAFASRRHSMLQRKWIRLSDARTQVAFHLWDACREATNNLTDEVVAREAQDQAGSFLIQAFSSGDLRSRGVEHSASGPVLHEPLPIIWWCRIVGEPPIIDDATSNLPVHHISWDLDQLVRLMLQSPAERLAIVTDIEVDRVRLQELVPLAEGSLEDEMPRRLGRPPDHSQHAAIRALAKDIIQDQFESVEAFAKLIADKFSEGNPAGIDTKQVRRILFGG